MNILKIFLLYGSIFKFGPALAGRHRDCFTGTKNSKLIKDHLTNILTISQCNLPSRKEDLKKLKFRMHY
jgi:hypothetical protein